MQCWCAFGSTGRKRNSSSSFESNASNSDASTDMNRMSNNNRILTNNSHQISVKAINQCMVSLQQNLNSLGQNQSESLTRLGVQRVNTISRQTDCRADKQLTHNCDNHSETIRFNGVNHEICKTGETINGLKKVCNLVNRVDNGLTNCGPESTSFQTNNYVNMAFMQSIQLYENIDFISNSNLDKTCIKSAIEEPVHRPNDKQEPHYELIPPVLNGTNLIEKSIVESIPSQTIDNYMLMRPIIANQTTCLDDKTAHKSIENILVNPSIQHLIGRVNPNKNKTSSLKTTNSQCRHFNEFRRRLSYRQRSNSTERRSTDDNKFCISSPNVWSCPSSPAFTSKSCLQSRQFFIVSKLSYKSKEKSFSFERLIEPKVISFS